MFFGDHMLSLNRKITEVTINAIDQSKRLYSDKETTFGNYLMFNRTLNFGET